MHSPQSVFSGVRVTRSLLLCVLFCRSLFVLLSFFFWPWCCLSFFDLRILITHLVSSNSSWNHTWQQCLLDYPLKSLITTLVSSNSSYLVCVNHVIPMSWYHSMLYIHILYHFRFVRWSHAVILTNPLLYMYIFLLILNCLTVIGLIIILMENRHFCRCLTSCYIY